MGGVQLLTSSTPEGRKPTLLRRFSVLTISRLDVHLNASAALRTPSGSLRAGTCWTSTCSGAHRFPCYQCTRGSPRVSLCWLPGHSGKKPRIARSIADASNVAMTLAAFPSRLNTKGKSSCQISSENQYEHEGSGRPSSPRATRRLLSARLKPAHHLAVLSPPEPKVAAHLLCRSRSTAPARNLRKKVT